MEGHSAIVSILLGITLMSGISAAQAEMPLGGTPISSVTPSAADLIAQ